MSGLFFMMFFTSIFLFIVAWFWEIKDLSYNRAGLIDGFIIWISIVLSLIIGFFLLRLLV